MLSHPAPSVDPTGSQSVMAPSDISATPSRRDTARRRTCLQVLPALVTGGVERGAVDMAIAQVAAGWRAIVASAGGAMVRELTRAGAEHITLPLDTKNPLGVRRNTKLLCDVIEREK